MLCAVNLRNNKSYGKSYCKNVQTINRNLGL